MRLPVSVEICGIKWNVIIAEHGYIGDDQVYGVCSYARKIIYIYKITFDVPEMNKILHDASWLCDTFYHELFHAMTDTIGLEKINTEMNCHLFSAIARNGELSLPEIFEKFKTIACEIDEISLRRLSYIINNTHLNYGSEGTPDV